MSGETWAARALRSMVGGAAIALSLAATGGGCTRSNPAYCDSETECSAEGLVCDEERHECVSDGDAGDGGADGICEENADCQEDGAPFCGGGGSCVACGDPCTLYVDGEEGDDGGSCGEEASPCETIGRALERLPGSEGGDIVVRGQSGTNRYRENAVIDGGAHSSVTLIGDDEVSRPRIALDASAPVFDVVNGATFQLETLRLEGDPSIAESAVECQGSSLVFRDVELSDFEGSGVDARDCELDVADSNIRASGDAGIGARDSAVEIANTAIESSGASGLRVVGTSSLSAQGVDVSGSGNGASIHIEGVQDAQIADSVIEEGEGRGVFADSSGLALLRSRIEGNAKGGLDATDSGVELVNNVIVKNGTEGVSELGGVRVRHGEEPATESRFAFNTIADNRADSEAAGAHAVDCGTADLRATSNILYFGSEELEAVSEGCGWRWRYSNIEDGIDIPSESTNFSAEPDFSETEGDYELSGESSCIDVAEADTGIDDDFTGGSRPVGEAPDCGAYEYREQ